MAEKILQKDFREFDKVYALALADAEAARKEAVGILDPALLKKAKINSLEKAGRNLVLDYGRNGGIQEYTPEDLRRFLASKNRVEERFANRTAGVPLGDLVRASSKKDLAASKNVRSATLYKVSGNLLSFRVTATGTTPGVSHHMVRVRLEDWTMAMHKGENCILGARAAATGRISFDCDCGRHQYWYRYLATMGNFALDPQERGFPKIRNPHLTGCCCKHALKVFASLRSGGVQLMLAKEMEKQAEATGFASKKARFLSVPELQTASTATASAKDIRAAQIARRKLLGMYKATERHKDTADILKKGMRPRGGAKSSRETRQDKDLKTLSASTRIELADTIRDVFNLAQKHGINADGMLDGLARGKGVSRSVIDDIAKQEGLL